MKALDTLNTWRAGVDRAQLLAAWPAWGGAIALMAAAVLTLQVSPQWQRQAEQHLAAVEQAGRVRVGPAGGANGTNNAKGPADPIRAGTTSAQVQDGFEWPAPERSHARGDALVALARRQGLSVQIWREQTDAQGQLQLSLTGRARYPVLRGWVASALAADPAAVLDRLRLQRADAAAPELDFEMQWTLLHRPKAPSTPATNTANRSGGAR